MSNNDFKKYIKLVEKRNIFSIVNDGGYSTDDVDYWANEVANAIKILIKIIGEKKGEVERLMREREIRGKIQTKTEHEKERKKSIVFFGGKFHHIVKRISELEDVIVTLERRITFLEKRMSKYKK